MKAIVALVLVLAVFGRAPSGVSSQSQTQVDSIIESLNKARAALANVPADIRTKFESTISSLTSSLAQLLKNPAAETAETLKKIEFAQAELATSINDMTLAQIASTQPMLQILKDVVFSGLGTQVQSVLTTAGNSVGGSLETLTKNINNMSTAIDAAVFAVLNPSKDEAKMMLTHLRDEVQKLMDKSKGVKELEKLNAAAKTLFDQISSSLDSANGVSDAILRKFSDALDNLNAEIQKSNTAENSAVAAEIKNVAASLSGVPRSLGVLAVAGTVAAQNSVSASASTLKKAVLGNSMVLASANVLTSMWGVIKKLYTTFMNGAAWFFNGIQRLLG